MSRPDESADREWARFLAGNEPGIRALRAVLAHLPSAPRCKICNAPFRGVGGALMKLVGKRPWERNPSVCDPCVSWLAKKGAGGAEVELSLLFADVRGSTPLAERLSATAYGKLIGRFFATATRVFVRRNAIIDQLVGDEVIGLFLPGFAGPRHAGHAIDAARHLLAATGHASARGPWLPLGAGVHTGVAYVGAVGSDDSLTDFTALGDSVNTTARLASAARAGEILVSRQALRHAGRDHVGAERRSLDLKGKTEPVEVAVLRVGAPG